MALDKLVQDVRENLRKGQYRDESAISQGVVLPILRQLGWPDHDTGVVWPQYPLENLKVDFALCSQGRPKVIVEVKRAGSEEGLGQLFNYAFHVGVPLAILTNGGEWTFFLPIAEGDYDERRLYKLDILERDIQESCQILEKYLGYEDVCSGKAIDVARRDHKDISQRQTAKKHLPQAWSVVLTKCDPTLTELLRYEVEQLCGHMPRQEDVEDFFKRRPMSNVYASSKVRQDRPSSKAPSFDKEGISCGFILRGKKHSARNATDAFVKIFEIFSSEYSDFNERFMAIKHGHKRRWFSDKKEDLYPGRPDLQEQYAHHLSSGYWVGRNESTGTFKKIIKQACEIAGEKDLRLLF